MTEADFALSALLFIPVAFCAIGFFLLFPSKIDRVVEWWGRPRAGQDGRGGVGA